MEVEQDILAGVPEADWVKTVKENLKKKFPNGITVGNNEIQIAGRSRQEMEEEQKASWEKITIEEHMEIYENQGHSRKEAMKMVANDRGMTKRDVYQYLINKTEE